MFRIDTTKPYSFNKQEWLKHNPSPYESYYACSHAAVRQTVKPNRAGIKMYRWQCQWCKRSVRTIRKSEVREDLPVYEWDEQGYKRVREALTAQYHDWATRQGSFFWEYYGAYLKSAAWRERRSRVVAAHRGLCQACGKAAISHVHHRHYRTLGEESTGDLAGLCIDCHRIQHEHMWKTPPLETTV